MAYKDFKSYIQDKYGDLLTTAIKEYVDKHHDGIGFHGFNVLSLAEQKIENVEVKSLICHEEGIGDLLRIEARTAADIVEMSLGTKEIEAGRKTRWFIVHMTAELHEGLHDVKVYKKLLELICRNEDKLKATMTYEQKALFEKYTDCVREHQTITDCLIFQNSFKLGARMMLEVMEDM